MTWKNRSIQLLFEQGVEAAITGNYSAACGLLQQVVDRCPNHPDAGRNLARAYFEIGNIGESIKAAKSFLKYNPRDAGGFLVLANAYNVVDKDDLAETYYKKAVEMGPHDPYALSGYGGWMLKQQRYDEAKLMIEQALGIEPNLPGMRLALRVIDEQSKAGKNQTDDNRPETTSTKSQNDNSESAMGTTPTGVTKAVRHISLMGIRDGGIQEVIAVHNSELSESEVDNAIAGANMGHAIRTGLTSCLSSQGSVPRAIRMVVVPPKRITENASAILVLAVKYEPDTQPPSQTEFEDLVRQYKQSN